jgi:DNA repair protein RecO (recombination protein O)
MALKESEAIVLRTYPLRESDLLVTLFTRLEGKVKGVARAAMKSRRRFRRRARAAHVRAGVLRRPRAAGTGAT